ncbi:MAG TPA: D-glycerate dehydrogenase [Ramlibacter sp.]|nr:D-glycerate dehydrogenase [Ramlibacter sp.]
MNSSILVCRAIAPEVIARLRQHFVVETNDTDEVWSQEHLIRRLRGKVGAFTTTSERIDGRVLAACPSLRICANMAVGHDNFDVDAMTARGVLATNAPDVLTETTADLGFALLMAAARRISDSERFLRAGKWNKWSYDMFCGPDIHGSTLGIVGMGRIGQAIARRGAHGFRMRVIYHNRTRLASAIEAECNASFAGMRDLLQAADHVVVVVPLTAETRHAIGAPELRLLKKSATLVNIGRGGVVDDAALAAALQAGQIAGAGLDVYEGEPAVHPDLLRAPNVVLTPHIGSASTATRLAMADLAARNLIGFLVNGQAITPINPQATRQLATDAFPTPTNQHST